MPKLYPKALINRQPSDCHPEHNCPPVYKTRTDNFYCAKCGKPLGGEYHDRNMRLQGYYGKVQHTKTRRRARVL